MKRIYVGNLPFATTEDDLTALFSSYGKVRKVTVVRDKIDGRPKGFAFVEMEEDDSALAAIEGLDGSSVGGRTVKVSEARPSTGGERGSYSGGDRGDRGEYRGGGGDRDGGGGRDRGSDRGGDRDRGNRSRGGMGGGQGGGGNRFRG